MADISGSFFTAPSGNSSSPVEIPGLINQGTPAPGVADALPMLFLNHSIHISNGAKGVV
jgi:hypothetical protein